MYSKLVSVLLVFFLLFGAVSAKISDDDKATVDGLSPETYIGKAVEITQRTVSDIRASKMKN